MGILYLKMIKKYLKILALKNTQVSGFEKHWKIILENVLQFDLKMSGNPEVTEITK